MASKLFLRSSLNSGITGAGVIYQDMLAAAGAASTTGVVDTTASGTEIQWTENTTDDVEIQFISGRVPSGGFTLLGTMTFSIWAHESHMNANIGARARVFKRTAAGSESEVLGGPFDDGVEFAVDTPTEMTWTATPTLETFAENDRLLVKFYITNVGTMASGHTGTLTYNAADASTGDSFFQIDENVTFKIEDVTGTSTVTEAADTSSIAGQVLISGAGATTEDADTSSITAFNLEDFSVASGTVSGGETTGTIAVTEVADTSSALAFNLEDFSVASGTVSVLGAIATTEADDASSIAALVATTGTSSVTEADDVSDATGAGGYSGTVAVTEAADASAINGLLTALGTLGLTESDDAASADGLIVILGTTAVTEALDSASVSGGVGLGGTVAYTEADDISAILTLLNQDDVMAASGTVSTVGKAPMILRRFNNALLTM